MIVCALLALKSKEIEVAGEDADVAGAQIGHHLRRVLQRGKRKNGAGALPPSAHFTALKPFSISSLRCCSVSFLLTRAHATRCAIDGMAGRHHLLEDFGIIGGVLADREEDAGGAFLRQRLQNRRRIHRPRTVVERQNHFLVAQEVQF